MRRILELANQQIVFTALFIAMAANGVDGPTWPAIAKYALCAGVSIGAWTLKDKLAQQVDRDKQQDDEREAMRKDFKDSLSAIVSANEKANDKAAQKSEESFKRISDSIASVADKATDLAIKNIELGVVVKGTQDNQRELQANQKELGTKLEALKDKELDELRQAKDHVSGKK